MGQISSGARRTHTFCDGDRGGGARREEDPAAVGAPRGREGGTGGTRQAGTHALTHSLDSDTRRRRVSTAGRRDGGGKRFSRRTFARGSGWCESASGRPCPGHATLPRLPRPRAVACGSATAHGKNAGRSTARRQRPAPSLARPSPPRASRRDRAPETPVGA